MLQFEVWKFGQDPPDEVMEEKEAEAIRKETYYELSVLTWS